MGDGGRKRKREPEGAGRHRKARRVAPAPDGDGAPIPVPVAPNPPTFTPTFIGFHNVGQGSSIALYDAAGNPRVYFDFGCPMFFNFPTIPPNNVVYPGMAVPPVGVAPWTFRNPRPCFHNTELMILSHWHWDHWAQAVMPLNAIPLAVQILAPVQLAGPMALGFWGGLAAAQQNLWPLGAPVGAPVGAGRAFNWGFLYRCTGPVGNVNRTGLAALVRLRYDATVNYAVHPVLGTYDPAPAFFAGERYALLLGDGDFVDLPFFNAAGPVHWPAALHLVGLAAPHHGSNLATPAAQYPAPVAAPGKIVFSYGVTHVGLAAVCTHCYTGGGAHEGHPRNAAVTNYHGQGWTYRMDNANDTCAGPVVPAPGWTPRQTNNNFAITNPGVAGPAVLPASFQLDGHGCAGSCRFRNFQT